MSKPREAWWGYVREMLRRYPQKTTHGELKAIQTAMEKTKALPDGEERIAVVKMVFFDRTHTLYGAATNIPCSYETAKRWQRQFIREVAEKRGLMG